MSKIDRYRKFCSLEPTIPIFSMDWWLDAVCPGRWDVCLVEKNGNVEASMPYFKYKNPIGMTIISQPPETQTLGPWLRKSRAKSSVSMGKEKHLLVDLFKQLPSFGRFQQSWHYSYTNWLPLYWEKFHATTLYTYILPDLNDLDAIWSGFRENIRTEIRKAQSRFNLKVRTDLDIDDFLLLSEKTFLRQDIKRTSHRELLRRIDKSCQENNARRIFIAEDEKGQHHAGVFIVWDQNSAYYLMGGGDPLLRNSGAASLCLWEAIVFASTVSKTFDFEGSMIESVERFFRAFGAIQKPYFSVMKTPSPLMRLWDFMVNFS